TNQVTISQSQNVTLSNSLVTTNNKSKPALKIEESDKVYVQQVNLDSFIRVDNSANVSIVGTNANDQLLITNDNVLSLNVDTRAGNDALTLVGDVAALNVNADGDLILTRATRVASPSGNVTLRAGGALTLEAGSVIDASAMNTGNGGTVTINSAGTKFYGNIFSRGGENGGNGGFVEVSGKYLLFEGNVDTRAPRGIAGNLLIDPDYVTVDSATTDDT
ncbi:MAG: hypothetical protein HY257_09375, partial [Chloroflexi bacterium]|nr:hypothetical protein [Chloroflexota bacterium]